MSFDVYQTTVPVFTRMLGQMLKHLEAAEAFAAVRKYDPSAFLQIRLAPDMFPLVRQVQLACDTAKMCTARLSGMDAPKHEDTEKTMAEVKARITSTLEFLKSVPAEKMVGAEGRSVTFNLRHNQPATLPGQTYVLGHGIPNFYFHYTTTYALLRHSGVELGKADYLGNFA